MFDNRLEEKEIDLIELLWDFIEQWRAILAVAVICALLLPLGMGLKAARSTISDEEGETEFETSLENEYQSMVSTLSLYMQYHSLEASYSNSVLNKVDFSNANIVISTYQLSCTDDAQRLVTLSSVVSSITADGDFVSTLTKLYTQDDTNTSISDVFRISVPTEDTATGSDTTTVIVSALLPGAVSEDEWNDTLTTAFEAYLDRISDTFGEADFKLIATNGSKATATYLSDLQKDKISYVSSARAGYQNAYSELSTDNKTIMDELIKKVEIGENEIVSIAAARQQLDEKWAVKQSEAEAQESVTPSIKDGFSVKYIAFGLFVGIFLYCGFAVLMAVFSRKISNAGEVESLLRVRDYGHIYEYPYKNAFDRFVHSKRIYEFRRKSTQPEKIASDLVTKLEFMDSKKVTLITFGKESKNVDKITRQQMKQLQDYGIEANLLVIDRPIADMEDAQFVSLDKVFVQILGHTTTYTAMLDLCNKLKEYEISLVGTEFIEVPNC